MSKWFLQLQGHVKGPYTNESMEVAISQLPDHQVQQALFWKRGLTEWLKASKWRADMQIQTNSSVSELKDMDTRTSAAPIPEKTLTETVTESVVYRVQLNFVDQPSMSKAELMTFISRQRDVSKISIQNPKTKEWNEVYAFPDIVESLGITRRKNTRVPILATFAGNSSKGQEMNAKVVTISEGGMGFTEVFALKIGDQVEGQMMSPHFFQPINLQADVIYSGLDGYIGLKFTRINDESKSAIIDYIKKFEKAQSQP